MYVKTGISGLDRLFANGGYPEGSTVLILGGPGSGKSIFGMQYVYKGAKEYGEPGVFVTLDEIPKKIKRNMSSFGWEIDAMEEENKLKILDAATPRLERTDVEADVLMKGYDVESIIGALKREIKSIEARRVVIDSISIMGIYSENEFMHRTKLLRLSSELAQMDVTTLIISEAKTYEVGISEFPSETFMVDGLVNLRLNTEKQERKVSIRKMRGTKHVVGTFPFKIDESGIELTH
jgi:KaiC/GvpD/RAD55 family RecA-like ATPase